MWTAAQTPKFRHLEIATTRTGMISLTGVFDDVNIDGTTVNHAYLHNLDNFMKLALGSGDIISVYKANIPAFWVAPWKHCGRSALSSSPPWRT